MLCQDIRTMFSDRLREAAAYAGVEYSQTAIARSLGMSKQTVDGWFGGGEPRLAAVATIAERWRVDPTWLATGRGEMVPVAPVESALSSEERAIVRSYRRGSPELKRILLQVAKGFGKAIVVLTLALPTLPHTQPQAAVFSAIDAPVYYVKWLWRRLLGLFYHCLLPYSETGVFLIGRIGRL
jgi:transcriptional regulator with XRE-family HTH domain